MLNALDQRKLRQFKIAGAVAMFLSSNSVLAVDELGRPCAPVYRGKDQIYVELTLSKTGHYCLMEDLVQRNVLDLIDGRNRGSPGKEGFIGVIVAKDVVLDMQGHFATSIPFESTTGINIRPSANSVTVKNGVIETPGPFGIGAWVVTHKEYVFSSFAREDLPPAFFSRGGIKVNWDYKPATHHVLDFLHIRSGGRGVVLAGDSNTLQNSTVEVDGAVAVYVYGPNAVIEGNTFIVHRPRDQYVPATSAILKLRDADNAVIRNNRFIFVDAFPGHARAEVAINLLTSKNVLIESNTAEGVNTLLRKDDSTNFFEQYNILK